MIFFLLGGYLKDFAIGFLVVLILLFILNQIPVVGPFIKKWIAKGLFYILTLDWKVY
jgi:hypothetical protein